MGSSLVVPTAPVCPLGEWHQLLFVTETQDHVSHGSVCSDNPALGEAAALSAPSLCSLGRAGRFGGSYSTL